MWWPILNSLGDWMKVDANLAAVQINYGATNPFPSQDFIDLRYGGSPSFDLAESKEGDSRVWIDVFKKLASADAETAPSTGAAYQGLYSLQSMTLASIAEWFRGTDAVAGAQFRVTTQEIDPDGDHFRADEFAGCRIILTLNWRI